MSFWDKLVEEAVLSLEYKKILYGILIPVHYPINGQIYKDNEIEVFDRLSSRERASVEAQLLNSTFQRWIRGDRYLAFPPADVNSYNRNLGETDIQPEQITKLVLFSSNDYLGLGSHPSVTKAVATAVLEHGMGPRSGTLMCGYTSYHQQLELRLADLKGKEDCLLCPTGFSANTAFFSALAYLGSNHSAANSLGDERIAIFSDAYNHASIFDGLGIGSALGSVRVFVYRHCDMGHLDELLSSSSMKKKVVITDSVFSMDGDCIPVTELVRLRKKHGFLLVLDEAHATLVYGKNGGGLAYEFGCEDEVDISIGTLSKAAGCVGGFIACSTRWKKLIQSKGRSYIYTAAPPIPVVAAALAAFAVARNEKWRRIVLWNLVKEFQSLTGISATSPIISIIVGSEEKAINASGHLLLKGFHVIAITPPAVPKNLSRLRLSLNVSHTTDDLKKLVTALSECQVIEVPNNTSHVALPRSRI